MAKSAMKRFCQKAGENALAISFVAPAVALWRRFGALVRGTVAAVTMVFSTIACITVSCLTTTACAATSAVVNTDPLNRDPAVRAAFDRFYILDYAGALDRFQKIAAAHPDDPIAKGYVLDTILFAELYRLDLLDTTLYAHDGFLSGKHPVDEDRQVTAQINTQVDRIVSQSTDLLGRNPKDVQALYARAWARSMKSIYIGLVQHAFISGLHLALQSRSDSDRILELDPHYVDADLVVGVHQYVAGSLPFAVKMMAGVVGEGGTKQKGLALLREAGQNGVITSVEARTALMLFLRREAKYAEASLVAQSLRQQYPHNFLYWLEEANLYKDSGDAAQAIAHYRSALEQAKKPGYFPNAHLQLPWYGLGDTLRGQHQSAAAAAAFEQVALQPGTSGDLKRRAGLAAGQQYDLLHDRARATAAYQAILRDAPASPQAAEAQKFLRSPYSDR